MKKLFQIALFLLVLSPSIFCQEEEIKPASLFDASWKEAETQNLESGQIVIRNIRKSKRISIVRGVNDYADEAVAKIEELDPVYLAEIIYKMPTDGNAGVINQAVKIFSDISLYKEIIYTDEKKGKSTTLFLTAELIEREDAKNDSGESLVKIATLLKMDMLSEYKSEMLIRSGDNGFFFEQKNKDPLKWKSINAVKPEKMVAAICCFQYEGFYYVYALGAVKAPKISVILKELERQFIGRIEDFTKFYIAKFDINRIEEN